MQNQGASSNSPVGRPFRPLVRPATEQNLQANTFKTPSFTPMQRPIRPAAGRPQQSGFTPRPPNQAFRPVNDQQAILNQGPLRPSIQTSIQPIDMKTIERVSPSIISPMSTGRARRSYPGMPTSGIQYQQGLGMLPNLGTLGAESQAPQLSIPPQFNHQPNSNQNQFSQQNTFHSSNPQQNIYQPSNPQQTTYQQAVPRPQGYPSLQQLAYNQPQQQGQVQQPSQNGYNTTQPLGNFQNMNPTPYNLMAHGVPIEDFSIPSPNPNVMHLAATPSLFSNTEKSYKGCTLTNLPQTAALLSKSGLPLALIITPFHQLLEGEVPVPVVQAPQIVRCRRCRTYINPWIQFVEQGTRWKCNMCFLIPSFFDWDPENRNRVDRMLRPELTHGVMEFMAPQEYMVRPPQPVVMLFVIDVSFGAVQSGMVASAAKAILKSLDGIPNKDNRTKIGFITFDSTLHFYNLAAGSDPQMLVVSDLEQPYLPLPYDLLVSLSESRGTIESFLEKLPTLFGTSQQTLSAMGKALKSAEKLIGSIGGKVICLQYSLPNHEEGSLKMREDSKILGTAKESSLLQPATAFYKNFAVECSPSQISIDLFLFNPQYADVATLSGCSKFTGGNLFYYQGFSASNQEDACKFEAELSHLLQRPLGLEAVLRIRASKGIKMSTFHGNFFLRSTDLLSLPNVNPDNSYTIELSITEEIKTSTACFQTALLYTDCTGERRIRVLTMCVPVTTSLSEVFIGADQHAIGSLLAKKAVDRALSSKIEDARDALVYKLAEIISIYKSCFNQQSHPQQMLISDNLKLLPAYVLAMIKNIAFREGPGIPSDLRSYMLSLHYVMATEVALVNLFPRFWNLNALFEDPKVGLPDANGAILFPPRLNLSSEKLDRSSAFLLENGLEMFVFVGRQIAPNTLMELFGQSSLDSLQFGKTIVPHTGGEANERLCNLIACIRKLRMKQGTIYPHLYLVREDGDPALRLWFLSHFIEDRIGATLSYPQFLGSIRERVQKLKG